MKDAINIFWFRRDLRLEDNTGLFHALKSGKPVLLIFIFDKDILEKLPKNDARVSFIYKTLSSIKLNLQVNFNSDLLIQYGYPLDIYKELITNYHIDTVFTNHDYEPYAEQRDTEIEKFLADNNISFKTYKDHVIFEKNEVVKSDGTPYLVYTPYMKSWKTLFKKKPLTFYKSYEYLNNSIKNIVFPILRLEDIGFQFSKQNIEDYHLDRFLVQNYESTRDFPAKESTSRLGPHLRFGTVSIRKIVQKAIAESNEIFWQELIWREFFIQNLWHFPKTITHSFKPKYDRIQWRNNEKEFELWCQGKTGYPLVDAGMNQLNQTGFMHNRVRMVVGSFLCKHLLIDWRWGEAYFAEKLHDYEMASNIGNWQWVAGCGVDAAPYFRIFNPTTQIEKFDKNLKYIKKWVPDFEELTYPKPIVDHKVARKRCLETYKKALV
ncbi:cryptochrome/photolyase family protein [Lacinutrix iliipiscaria]|uniref:Cryptochrome/photolyase family protein n=1 Tax=Lacinutrix iliipiscaria TaxID=1230532 RepID=A0ABW5WRM9_9FLAO